MNRTVKRLLPAGLIALVLHVIFLCWQLNLKQRMPSFVPSKRITVSLGVRKVVEPSLAEKQKTPPVEETATLVNKAKTQLEPAKPIPPVKKTVKPKVSQQKKRPKPKIKEQVIAKKEKEVLEQPLPVPPTTKAPAAVQQHRPPQTQLAVAEAPKSTIEATPLYHLNPKPKYPSRARRRGWQGTVLFAVEVLADGSAGKVTLHQSSGYTILDKAGMAAIRKWRFIPGVIDGTVQTMKVIVPLKFSLK